MGGRYRITHKSVRFVKLPIAGESVPAKSWLLRRLGKERRKPNNAAANKVIKTNVFAESKINEDTTDLKKEANS
jgi:acyl dehydratase